MKNNKTMKKIFIPILSVCAVALAILIGVNINSANADTVDLKTQVTKMSEGLSEKESVKFKMLNSTYFYNTVEGTFTETFEYKDGAAEEPTSSQEFTYYINNDSGLAYSSIENLDTNQEVTETTYRIVDKEDVDIYTSLTENTAEEVLVDTLDSYNSLNTKEIADNTNYIAPETPVSDLNPIYIEMLGSLDRIDNDNRVNNDVFSEVHTENDSQEEYPSILGTSLDVMTRASTNPQEAALLFLHEANQWEITDHITYKGRNALQIEGTVSPEVKNNFGNFKLIIDEETGIALYQYIEYNENDNILKSRTLETQKITVDGNSMLRRSAGPTSKEAILSTLGINEAEYTDITEIKQEEAEVEYFTNIVNSLETKADKQSFETYLSNNSQLKEKFSEILTNEPELKTQYDKVID